MSKQTQSICIVGGGPAGLMAAEVLAQAGLQVEVFDAMPSVGRKFLLAGVGGMNITHSEPPEPFLSRYGAAAAQLKPMLDEFGGDALRDWVHGLGIQTFVGSSGRVFPTEMKAAPLLRAWLVRLKAAGVKFHPRHRWLGWNAAGELQFATPDGEITRQFDATLLALGGASWAKLGSDGKWLPVLAAKGVNIAPLQAANCGFDVNWSPFLAKKFAGTPLKAVAASASMDERKKVGEFVITEGGVEGSLVYAISSALREQINLHGSTTLWLDLLPQKPAAEVHSALMQPRGADSMANHLRRKLKIEGIKAALLHEILSKEQFMQPDVLAAAIKSLPIKLLAPRPIDEAISTAGGVKWDAVDQALMLKAAPGVFVAGEMLDWEAPTGGYLLTACFATGRHAAHGILAHLQHTAA
ncbi:TIGR03862 family flavoprotein [Chitinibacter bivalviorum]|uniref:TIGR03862 family flavoprotein n=1 Tax=Chitinibacter bivalviorum TaxID=2739434 RepID=A0A7H9BM60_9NEIS|nr:TIGR03862 family flavoprotein [Chitinibacter bivalviorum]QLG89559.1 TIGR03862 family flavoprotein [Chitinibacter bivalviorum]